jgi:hypothetical protein
MAAITSTTLDRVERTLFFRVNKQQVPLQLPWDLVTIDYDFQAYEPVSTRVALNGARQRGVIAGAVYLQRAQGVPRPAPGTKNPDAFPVFFYGGI